jgi:hypothetical protein
VKAAGSFPCGSVVLPCGQIPGHSPAFAIFARSLRGGRERFFAPGSPGEDSTVKSQPELLVPAGPESDWNIKRTYGKCKCDLGPRASRPLFACTRRALVLPVAESLGGRFALPRGHDTAHCHPGR